MRYLRPQRSPTSSKVRGRLRSITKVLSPELGVAPVSIPCFKPAIGEEEIAAAVSVLQSGWLTTGPKAREFETNFAAFMGGDVEAIAVNSATAGLHLAAEACGIGPGDQVLVPTLTFTATASVIRYLGAEVILVDVEEHTRCIDLDDAARRLTSRCKAIIPVHFGGFPCDMSKVLRFARRHGLKVIEDAAHALPARHNGRLIGSWESDACVFSFYASKPITTGEGGMVVTRDPQIASRVRVMRTHGLDRDAFDRFRKVGSSWAYDVVAPGFKYNLTDVAAAIGLVQLSRAEALRASRQRSALRYFEQLAGLPVDCPPLAPRGGLHSWHLFPIRVHENARATRDDLMQALAAEGIGTSVHYRPLHEMRYWRDHCRCEADDFAVAGRYFAGAVTLPLFAGMSDAQVDRVAAVVRDILG